MILCELDTIICIVMVFYVIAYYVCEVLHKINKGLFSLESDKYYRISYTLMSSVLMISILIYGVSR